MFIIMRPMTADAAARKCVITGHTEHDLPNGCTVNGVMLNGAPQSESDPDSDSDEFGQEAPTPNLDSVQAAAVTLEHSRKQPSGHPLPSLSMAAEKYIHVIHSFTPGQHLTSCFVLTAAIIGLLFWAILYHSNTVLSELSPSVTVVTDCL